MIATKIKTHPKALKAVVIPFFDDSNDRIPLAETLFPETSILFHTNIALLLNHPTEIRAPEAKTICVF